MPTAELVSGTKHEKVAEFFRKQIASRSLQPGEVLPSFAKVRADLGISQVTYERAQSLLEREGLVLRHPSRGAFVAHKAIAKAGGSIALAGLGQVGSEGGGYWGELFEGIRDAARAERKSIMLLDSPELQDDWTGIAGLIAGPFTIVRAPIPSISLISRKPGYTSVMADEGAGISAAMAHLTKLGHRRIAYLPAGWAPTLAERVSGYRNGLMNAGIIPDPRRLRTFTAAPSDYFYDHGRLSMQQWLADDWKELGCTALLAWNDECALGVIDALRAGGYSVPEDVSVVGFDGILTESKQDNSLTTVVMPLFALGRKAVHLLSLASDSDAGTITIKLDAPLRIGSTTAPAR